MASYTLKARSALDGFRQDYGGCVVEEIPHPVIFSLATPLGGEERFRNAVGSEYGADAPAPGASVMAQGGTVRLLGLAQDQLFVLSDPSAQSAERSLPEELQKAGYWTEQSDNWAVLRVSGPDCRTVLERICMLDLHPDVFVVNALARTLMEHLSVIIVREAEDSFLLMSARSSAGSFLHGVTVSAEYAL